MPVAAHSMRECRRAMARRSRLFADLGSSVTPMLARMLARAVDGTDFRLSRSGGGTVPVAAHSLRECRRAMERRGRLFADLGSSVTPMLARMLARAVDGTDFRASRSGGEREPAAAHSRRECGTAMGRRRGQFADLGSPVTPMLAHMLARPILDFRHLRTATVGRRVNAIVTRVGAGPIC